MMYLKLMLDVLYSVYVPSVVLGLTNPLFVTAYPLAESPISSTRALYNFMLLL